MSRRSSRELSYGAYLNRAVRAWDRDRQLELNPYTGLVSELGSPVERIL